MKFIQGQDRNQTALFPVSLEQAIDPVNEVHIIDLFVDSLPLIDYGFKADYQENGRPAYRPEDMLKLFIYGYLNKGRSMRHLEKETCRNIEVIWLLRALTPDYNTIFLVITFSRAIKVNLYKIFALMPPVDIHMKNIKYLINKFIFGNKLRITMGL